MARKWAIGFEKNTTTAGVEYGGFDNSGTGSTISSTQAHSGTYAFHTTVNTTGDGFQKVIATGNGPIYARYWIRVHAAPTGTTRILWLERVGTAVCASIRITSTRTLILTDSSATQVGSASSALTLDTWYYVELYYKNNTGTGKAELEARLEGSVFATTTTNTNTGTVDSVAWGTVAADATLDFYVDDIVVDDAAYPGPGKLVYQLPNGAGDSTQWTPDTGSNYTRVDEITPDDATSYVAESILNKSDFYTVGASGIGSGDTVKTVFVNARFRNDTADATTNFQVQIKKITAGTVQKSSAITPNTTTWSTNTVASPHTPPLILTTDPDSAAWTQSTLDSMQIGLLAGTVGVNKIQVTAMWVIVEYIPVTTKTITAVSRITATTTKTITGLARITVTTLKTITGLARITKTTLQTITGLSRITASTPKTINALSRITATTLKTITGNSRIQTTSTSGIGSALQFDGVQNYVNLGTLSTLGSNLGSGLYISFKIKTTSTSLGEWGFYTGSKTSIIVGLNNDKSGSLGSGKLSVYLQEASAKATRGGTVSSTNFNDGNVHTIVMTVSPSTNTITILVDGISQSVNYSIQTTPATFANFGNNFYLGARLYLGSLGNYFNAIVDDFKIGTSSSTLFGLYTMDEGSGTSITDTSGQNNTGTLGKGAAGYPNWINGLNLLMGLSRITASTPKTISGLSRITATTPQTISALARITATTTKTINGVSRIQKTVGQTITGVANIAASFTTTTKTITGLSRITATTLKTITGKARIQVTAGIRTNLVVNPSFEADTAGNGNIPGNWSTYGSAVTYKGVATDFSKYGVNSFKVSNATNTDSGMYIQISGLTVGSVVSFSVWVKSDSSVTNATVILDTVQHSAGGSKTSGNNQGASVNARISVSNFVMDTTKLNIFLGMGSFGSQSSGNVWFDGAMLEKVSDYSNTASYFDGSIAGGSWTGTSNASTSTIPVRFLTGVSRITQSVPKTISGLSRITNSSLQVITGKSRITVITSRTVTGKSRITQQSSTTLSGKSRLSVSVQKAIQAVANIQNTDNYIIMGVANIIHQPKKTISGKSKIKRVRWYNNLITNWENGRLSIWQSQSGISWETAHRLGWFTDNPINWKENQ